jgi:hypothetical protein
VSSIQPPESKIRDVILNFVGLSNELAGP